MAYIVDHANNTLLDDEPKKVEDDIYPQQKTLTITMLGMVGS